MGSISCWHHKCLTPFDDHALSQKLFHWKHQMNVDDVSEYSEAVRHFRGATVGTKGLLAFLNAMAGEDGTVVQRADADYSGVRTAHPVTLRDGTEVDILSGASRGVLEEYDLCSASEFGESSTKGSPRSASSGSAAGASREVSKAVAGAADVRGLPKTADQMVSGLENWQQSFPGQSVMEALGGNLKGPKAKALSQASLSPASAPVSAAPDVMSEPESGTSMMSDNDLKSACRKAMGEQQTAGDKRGNSYVFPMEPLNDNMVNNLGLSANGAFKTNEALTVVREEDEQEFDFVPWVKFRRACEQAWKYDNKSTFTGVWDRFPEFATSYTDRQGRANQRTAINGKFVASRNSAFPPDHFKFSDEFTMFDLEVTNNQELPACKSWLGPVRCNLLGLDA